jgi:hypothetical protein
MRLVVDHSVAAKWYFHDADYLKAQDLRWNFSNESMNFWPPLPLPPIVPTPLYKLSAKGH